MRCLQYADLNDETLVLLTLAGEQDAYGALVARYERAVVASALSVTRNYHLAEDAAQDAFVTAWMKLDTLREPQKFAPWVSKIAKNCARNLVQRFQSYLPLEDVENLPLDGARNGDPESLYVSAEERKRLHDRIDGLPERVRQAIRLYYFEDLSVAEIAERMRLSVGTVKWQLHDGRKRLRKELCAMNEEWNDTLLRRVMKKVEELKLWQTRNSKNGFAEVYRDVLDETEELPESADKYRMLADVLLRGWWWIPGRKNDELFARIRDAAERGKNDEVMAFVVSAEDAKVPEQKREQFVREQQIPRLEKDGFRKAAAQEWRWLAQAAAERGEYAAAKDAFGRAKAFLEPSDVRYASVCAESELPEVDKGKSAYTYRYGAQGIVLRKVGGEVRFWEADDFARGWGWRWSFAHQLLRNASRCDGAFTPDGMRVGETRTGSDGTTLTFASDDATAETPCGKFDGCSLWVTEYHGAVVRNYYRSGVGLVRQELWMLGVTETVALRAYHVCGGEGLLPCAVGNRWTYEAVGATDGRTEWGTYEVLYDDGERTVLKFRGDAERAVIDTSTCRGALEFIRQNYCDHENTLLDVTEQIALAEKLAKTPLEKAHAQTACAVARRIWETDPESHPDCKTVGLWDFFVPTLAENRDGKVLLWHEEYSARWSFEWKHYTPGREPILHNGLYGILSDATNGELWSDEWTAERTVEAERYRGLTQTTKLRCEEIGTVETGAGTFANCRKLTLEVRGLEHSGWDYRGGRKEYVFAPGVGIVKAVHDYYGGLRQVVYELTEWTGGGEGYFPLADGMTRRYDAVGLTDGFEAYVIYRFVEGEKGKFVLFADQCGVQHKGFPVTLYGTIQSEETERTFLDGVDREAGFRQQDFNNLRMLLYFLRKGRGYWGFPERAVRYNRARIRLLLSLGTDGEVPRAWLGVLTWLGLREGCALFGLGRKEEGYASLERALDACRRWAEIPDGEALETDDGTAFGGIRLCKDTGKLLLPDGSYEPTLYELPDRTDRGTVYTALTRPSGWEWFDGARDDERFRELVERAKKLMEG